MVRSFHSPICAHRLFTFYHNWDSVNSLSKERKSTLTSTCIFDLLSIISVVSELYHKFVEDSDALLYTLLLCHN